MSKSGMKFENLKGGETTGKGKYLSISFFIAPLFYFLLNFSGQTASEVGSKPSVTRSVRFSTCREALQKV
jgi:hypothetical protein